MELLNYEFAKSRLSLLGELNQLIDKISLHLNAIESRAVKLWSVRNWEYPWVLDQMKRFGLERNHSILDVGSGVSIFPTYLRIHGYNVTSLDNNKDKLEIERFISKCNEIFNVKTAYFFDDITRANKEDSGKFNLVLCISVLEHIEEEAIEGTMTNNHKNNLDTVAIERMLSLLRSDGHLVLTVEVNESYEIDKRSYSFFGEANNVYQRILNPFKDSILNYKIFSREEIARSLNDAKKLWMECFPFQDHGIRPSSLGIVMKSNSSKNV